jgi:hypothetical protein
MTFESYIEQAWKDHATQTEKVAQQFADAGALIETADQLNQFVALVTHVMGEHLAQWEEGVAVLRPLQKNALCNPSSESEKSILRSIEVLKLAGGQPSQLSSFSRSDRIRILAVAAGALGVRDSVRTENFLMQALHLAGSGLERKDAANRALAIAGNNLACALEEKIRTPQETEVMILAAQTGRTFWEIAGTWLEVSKAEYRLAMTYVKAGDLAAALAHAQTCIEICENNSADALSMFYAYEGLAVVSRARRDDLSFQKALDQTQFHFEKLSPQEQSWCESSLRTLRIPS